MLEQIDIYCERIGPAFWAEPVNALTNIAFVLAGLAALRFAAMRDRLDAAVVVLAANAVIVGIGSFLFHTFATRWAALADVVPILAFVTGYLAAALRRFAGFGLPAAALGTLAGFLALIGLATAFSRLLDPWAGGGQAYLPVLVLLIGMGLWLGPARGHPAGRAMLGAAGVFAVSLTFRTMDDPVCGAVPLGTHFLWHLLNGLVLWILLAALIRHGAPAGGGRQRLAGPDRAR